METVNGEIKENIPSKCMNLALFLFTMMFQNCVKFQQNSFTEFKLQSGNSCINFQRVINEY